MYSISMCPSAIALRSSALACPTSASLFPLIEVTKSRTPRPAFSKGEPFSRVATDITCFPPPERKIPRSRREKNRRPGISHPYSSIINESASSAIPSFTLPLRDGRAIFLDGVNRDRPVADKQRVLGPFAFDVPVGEYHHVSGSPGRNRARADQKRLLAKIGVFVGNYARPTPSPWYALLRAEFDRKLRVFPAGKYPTPFCSGADFFDDARENFPFFIGEVFSLAHYALDHSVDSIFHGPFGPGRRSSFANRLGYPCIQFFSPAARLQIGATHRRFQCG